MNTRNTLLPSVRSAAAVVAMLASMLAVGPSHAAVIYSNLDVNGQIGMASRPDNGGVTEVEAADDFVLTRGATISQASFIGLIPRGVSVMSINLEIYRVFPLDSDVTRTSGAPTFSTAQVPTRVNSPSDVAFAERDSTLGQLNFSTAVLSTSFTAANSVGPDGIHPLPGSHTGGNGPITGEEVRFDVDLTVPIFLDPNHYFFIPQVELSDGTFFWLSASRPIDASGTPIAPDLQAWIRDENLDPDWLRVGTDIVGGTTPPTFNAAFALIGTPVPEPASMALLFAGGAAALAIRRRRPG
jgi:PEP-CTERM motif